MNPHLKGHKSFAEMVAGHILHWESALQVQMGYMTDRFDRAFIKHELNALADIKAACALEMEAAPVGGLVELYRADAGAVELVVPHRAAFDPPGPANAGMGSTPPCPKEPEVKLFGAEVFNVAVEDAPTPYWVLLGDGMRDHPRLGNGPNVRTSEVKEIWDFDGAIFARTKSGTLYKIMDWAADWIGSHRHQLAVKYFPCLQGLKA